MAERSLEALAGRFAQLAVSGAEPTERTEGTMQLVRSLETPAGKSVRSATSEAGPTERTEGTIQLAQLAGALAGKQPQREVDRRLDR